MSRRLSLLIVGLLVVLSAAAIVHSGRAAPTSGDTINLSLPSSIIAGEPLEIAAAIDGAHDGQTLTVILTGSYGPKIYRATIAGTSAQFSIPGDETKTAGVTTVTASLGSSRAQSQLTINAGPAADPIQPLIGAKHLTADGVEWTTLVVVPVDRFGNPLPDGTQTTITISNPDGSIDKSSPVLAHLAAATKLYVGTVAGRTTVAATVSDARGPSSILDQTPGWPAEIEVTFSPSTQPADGTSEVMLKTGVLADRFGNVVADGTLVTFVATDSQGERRIPAITVDGVATAPLLAPTQPGTVDVVAVVYDIASPHVSVEFTAGPAVGLIPLTATVDQANGELTVSADPVLTALGAFAPDGTIVTFTIDGPVNLQATANILEGTATAAFRLVDLPPGSYSITATAGSGTGSIAITIPAT